MAMNLTRPVGTVVSDNAPVGKGPMRDLLNDLVSAIEGKAEIQDSGKLFFDRASAVSAGQEKLVPAIGRIFTVEGDDLVLRGQGQTGDDPLFATSPRWGVVDRYPARSLLDALASDLATRRIASTANSSFAGTTFPTGTTTVIHRGPAQVAIWLRLEGGAPTPALPIHQEDKAGQWWERAWQSSDTRGAVASGALMPLAGIGGTGDAWTAELGPAFTAMGITALSADGTVEYIPALPNMADNPTGTIGGVSYAIRNADGGTWPARGFAPGRPYTLRRRGSQLRVIGDVAQPDLAAARLARITGDAQMGSVMLEGIAGTGDAITAAMPGTLSAIGIAAANIREVIFTVPAANTTGTPTLNIDGQGAVPIRDHRDGPLPAGALVPGPLYRAVKVAGRWRIVTSEVDRAFVAGALSELRSAPEDIGGGRVIIEAGGMKVLVAEEDGLDFVPSRKLKEKMGGTGGPPPAFDVAQGFEGDALVLDAADQLVIGIRPDGLDMTPSGRMVARLMEAGRFAGVAPGAMLAGTDATGRAVFAHGALGPRAGLYRVGNAGAPEVAATRSILVLHYGQSNAGTVGQPSGVADRWPAHVVVPNDGRWQYGPNNNNEQPVNLNALTGFRPTDLLASGKASIAVPAAMVVAARLSEPVRMIVRAEGRPSRAMVAANGILYEADGTTLSQNFLNLVATALKILAVAADDGAPVDRIYVPFTHQENDKDTPAATYAAHLNALIDAFAARIRAVHPGMAITWMLDELAGWSDLGNAFPVRNALGSVADARPGEVVYVGPRYPYALLDGVHMHGEGQLRFGALLGEAIAATELGQGWQAPRLSGVARSGRVIVLDWSSALPLVFDDFAFPTHESVRGFSLSGIAGGAVIESVVQTGPRRITVTLSEEPSGGDMRLRYAWRAPQSTDPALLAGRPFGNGALRDAFSAPSLFFPGEGVHRFAIGFDAAI